jgi:anti-anti-sigma regulatory factor
MQNIELGPALSDLAALGTRVRVSLDFREIGNVSAATLTKLLVLRRNLRSLGGQLVLRNVPPFASEVFHATHLDALFEVRRKRSHSA